MLNDVAYGLTVVSFLDFNGLGHADEFRKNEGNEVIKNFRSIVVRGEGIEFRIFPIPDFFAKTAFEMVNWFVCIWVYLDSLAVAIPRFPC